MKTLLSIACLFIGTFLLNGQELDHRKKVKHFQDSINAFLKDPAKTQILAEELATFQKIDFFPINDSYKIKARLEESPTHELFKLTYSTDPNVPVFVVYGKVYFELNGKARVLNVYQNKAWLENNIDKTHLFLPFKDWTNGSQSYGGGRFINLCIPSNGNELILDFNLSYNPPCAYNYNMACPLIPESNYIEMEVFAGILAY